jgi:hypothetical protein
MMERARVPGRGRLQSINLACAIMGVLVIAAALGLTGMGSTPFWVGVLTGAVIVLIAAFNVGVVTRTRPFVTRTPTLLVAVAGAWLIAAPFLVSMPEAFAWTIMLLGAFTLALSGYAVRVAGESRAEPARRPAW